MTILPDRAHAIVMEDIAAEGLCLTVARVKALFGYSKDKLADLINVAEAQPCAHAEETAENIKETELDDAWDLNAAEDAPTEC
jgi:hypothetical protein